MNTVKVIDPLSVQPRVESDWTFAAFERPVTLREDRSYAITLLTEDSTHSVAIADLGGFDQINGWVTSNAFPLGTFLDGSDSRTWLPKPGRSLGFRLRCAKYAQAVRTIEVGDLPVVNCSDLMPLLAAERPEGTAIEVEFEAPNGAKYVTAPAVNVSLPQAVTGTLKVRLRVTGKTNLWPIMLPYVQVVAGAIQATGDYITRAFEAGTDFEGSPDPRRVSAEQLDVRGEGSDRRQRWPAGVVGSERAHARKGDAAGRWLGRASVHARPRQPSRVARVCEDRRRCRLSLKRSQHPRRRSQVHHGLIGHAERHHDARLSAAASRQRCA